MIPAVQGLHDYDPNAFGPRRCLACTLPPTSRS
jgi:hypothetical protein